jgi:putative Mg2+ transporter-C (MgtC) family protein
VELEWLQVMQHLVVALVAGALIGMERSYHGRPAGFRTHTLVCVASSLLMLVTMYHGRWFANASVEVVRIDPTRMAQGIMTGIGFLGAGVIMREGLTVRGLTTAASIWITAAIGIMAGIGFYSAAIMATIIALGTLSVFRMMEKKMPAQIFASQTVLFNRENLMTEEEVKTLFHQCGFSMTNISYHLLNGGRNLEYRMTVRTMDKANIEKLCHALLQQEEVVEFCTTQVRG